MRKYLLILALFLVGSCADDSKPKVGIIGDSITFLTTAEVENTLTDQGYQVVSRSDLGITIENSRTNALFISEYDPEVVVINLGTNDAGNVDYVTSTQKYNEMLNLFSGCKVIVNLSLPHEFGHEVPAEKQEFLKSFNEFLDGLESILDNVVIVDWAKATYENPEWVPDGVHPTATKEYAGLISNAVEECDV